MVPLAKKLRKKQTAAEKLLWEQIKERKLMGFKFRRQAPFGRYILDFYCTEKHLALEVDGPSHEERKEYDANRDSFIKSAGVKTLRFTNKDIRLNLPEVLQIILSILKQ